MGAYILAGMLILLEANRVHNVVSSINPSGETRGEWTANQSCVDGKFKLLGPKRVPIGVSDRHRGRGKGGRAAGTDPMALVARGGRVLLPPAVMAVAAAAAASGIIPSSSSSSSHHQRCCRSGPAQRGEADHAGRVQPTPSSAPMRSVASPRRRRPPAIVITTIVGVVVCIEAGDAADSGPHSAQLGHPLASCLGVFGSFHIPAACCRPTCVGGREGEEICSVLACSL